MWFEFLLGLREVHPVWYWPLHHIHWPLLSAVASSPGHPLPRPPGGHLNIKMSSYQYRDPHVKDKTVARPSCLVHPGVRDKRRVSEIDLSQPRHETAFWWRHNGPVTSQLTNRIKWPNYPVELIGIYVHINTHNKESLAQRCRRSTNVQLCLIFLYISIWFES